MCYTQKKIDNKPYLWNNNTYSMLYFCEISISHRKNIINVNKISLCVCTLLDRTCYKIL